MQAYCITLVDPPMTPPSAWFKVTRHAESYTDSLKLRSRKEQTTKDIDDSEENNEGESEEDIGPDVDALQHRDLEAPEGDESPLNEVFQSLPKRLRAPMSRSPLLSSSTAQDASAYAVTPGQRRNTGLSSTRPRVKRHRSSLESTLASGVGIPARQGSGLFEDISQLLPNEDSDEEAVIDVDSEDAHYNDENPPDNSPLVCFIFLHNQDTFCTNYFRPCANTYIR